PGALRLAESLLVSRPGSLVIRLPRQAHDPNPAVAVPRPGSPGEPRPTGAPHVPYPAATRRPARGHNARPSTTSTAPQSYARARAMPIVSRQAPPAGRPTPAGRRGGGKAGRTPARVAGQGETAARRSGAAGEGKGGPALSHSRPRSSPGRYRFTSCSRICASVNATRFIRPVANISAWSAWYGDSGSGL